MVDRGLRAGVSRGPNGWGWEAKLSKTAVRREGRAEGNRPAGQSRARAYPSPSTSRPSMQTGLRPLQPRPRRRYSQHGVVLKLRLAERGAVARDKDELGCRTNPDQGKASARRPSQLGSGHSLASPSSPIYLRQMKGGGPNEAFSTRLQTPRDHLHLPLRSCLSACL